MNFSYKLLHFPILITALLLFVVFYPMLISIYVFLPLFIGVMGYMLMRGIDKNNPFYIFISLFYFINLEVNLSLPLFLTILVVLLIYAIFYHHLNYFRKCVVCRPIISVILIDLFYLVFLLTYDFIFQTSNVMIDNILLYTLIVDLLVVVLF